MGSVIWTLVALLFVCWVVGFAAHVGGSLIHFLLLVAVIVALFQFLAGRSATRV